MISYQTPNASRGPLSTAWLEVASVGYLGSARAGLSQQIAAPAVRL